MTWRVDVGDCVDLMAAMPPCSVDAIVCDPPYELSFMGRAWDRSGVSYQVSTWAEALRVLKPGGHLLAFGGTRTSHRLACAIEDAGFEIRDTIAWLYGSGFPKSLDVGKAIDKAAGAEREDVYEDKSGVTNNTAYGSGLGVGLIERRPATPDAVRWDGWGTALKPAHEPIVVARKPLAGTVAANVLEHGVGALNVDGCRVAYETNPRHEKGGSYATRKNTSAIFGADLDAATEPNPEGRWPANVVLDEDAARLLDEQTEDVIHGAGFATGGYRRRNTVPPSMQGRGGYGHGQDASKLRHGDSGGASRFFYCAKASRAERNAGLEGFEDKAASSGSGNDRGARRVPGGWEYDREPHPRKNTHPTVKPVALMRWLVRLVTPPDGLVLDPFTGSGTTGIAATLEGLRFHGLEREDDYADIARARIGWWAEHGHDALRIVAEHERAELERRDIAGSGQTDLLSLLDDHADEA